MIIRFFDTGQSNGNSPVNYLLSEKDRKVKPEVLEGDSNATIQIINSIDRSYKYSSGVIAFRNNEMPTRAQMHEIIATFRRTMLPGLTDENFNDLWVLHKDKGNVELHFVIPMEEMTTGKRLNIMPPGPKSLAHKDLLTKVLNHEYGWQQVVENPLKAQLSDFEFKVLPKGVKQKAVKSHLVGILQKRILSGEIKDRGELVEFLNDHKINVTRQGDNYISVKLPGFEKARRLKGELFNHDADYKELLTRYHSMQDRQALTLDQYLTTKGALAYSMLEREKFNTDVYLTPKKSYSRLPKTKTPVANTIKIPMAPKHDLVSNISMEPASSQDSVELTKEKISENLTKMRKAAANESSYGSTGSANGAWNSVLTLEIQMGNLNGQISRLNGKLSQEMNPRKQLMLIQQMGQLKLQLEAMGQQLRMAKAKEYAERFKIK